MRIFKNRGDIYISKNKKEATTEQRILLLCLILVVLFTIAFVIFLGAKYEFSIYNFFKPDDLEITTEESNADSVILPEVSGKYNYIVVLHDGDDLLYTTLIQVDMDNISYKVCNLKASTQFDGESLEDTYSLSLGTGVKEVVEKQFSTSFDYYVSLEQSDFTDLLSELGKVVFLVNEEIRYKNSDTNTGYSLKIKAGEQSINSTDFVELIRYYLDVEENTTYANTLVLNALSQLLNSENMEDFDSFFNNFVKAADTNITIRDYAANSDNLKVLSDESVSPAVYSASVEYNDDDTIDSDSLKNAKGYFGK